MNRFTLAFAFAATAITTSALAAVTPCETALKELRAAESKASLNDADKNKASGLETKGIERCNADNDKRADDFFAQVMKILGK